MSRRTFPKCVAAGLLAAVVSPAAAQSPNPWRTGGCEVAPAPRPVARQTLSISLGWSATAGPVVGVTHTAKPAPQTPKPAPPPEMQASMLRELERMGAQTSVPSWTPPAASPGTVVTLPPAVGLWVGGFQTWEPGSRLPDPQDYTRNFPQYFPADPQHFAGGPPRVASLVPATVCPPPVVNCDGDRIEALSQLSNACANSLFRVLPTRTYISGMTLPSPRYLNHYPQSGPCDPPFPLQRELAVPCPAPVATVCDIPLTLTPPAARAAGSPPVGIWHRTVGGMAYTITVKDEHLTIAVRMSMKTDEGTVTHGVVLTGDYHVSRDGSNLVGLVTSVDATLDGATEPEDVTKLLTKLQKSMTDKPFAVSFRVYDGRLVVGNVRLPACEDYEVGELLGTLGGYYQPTSEYGRPTPPKAGAPLKVVPASGLTPLPPIVVPGTRIRSSKPYPTDPNVRMQQLLFQVEDLRQIDSSWRDFWFREPPHHLTPERIHGAIF